MIVTLDPNKKASEPAPEAVHLHPLRNSLVMVPVAIVMPAMVAAIPPSVIPAEAAFAFRVQVPPPLIRLPAAFAVFANRLIQFRLGLLNLALALRVVVRIRLGHGNERRRTQSHCHHCRHRSLLDPL
jgi:hypothetical protein